MSTCVFGERERGGGGGKGGAGWQILTVSVSDLKTDLIQDKLKSESLAAMLHGQS